MFLDIQPTRSHHGGHLDVQHAAMGAAGAAAVFVQGDLVFLDALGQLSNFPMDGTQAIIADLPAGTVGTLGNVVGVAAWGPGQLATAEIPRTRVMINPTTGLAFVQGDLVGYYPGNRGNLFKAQVLAAGGAAAGVGLATHKGEMFQISSSVGTTPDLGWGVELTAAVSGTDIIGLVVEVLAADGRVSATAGTHFLFELFTLVQ